jgi:hypothetical protein
MRRLPPVEIFIIVLTAIFLIVGWKIYGAGEMGRFGGVEKAQKAPSQLYARMLIRYDKPPIYEEEYRMQDIEGVSNFEYRIRSYNCKEITIKAPTGRIYDVSFFFGSLDQDGIWQLTNKPPLPNADAHYTVYVKQLADFKEGERTVTFTNPDYWATHSQPHQFNLDLSKQGPNDLLHIQSKHAEPGYKTIVDDFRGFGSQEFRSNVAAAQARARASACK